jgi:hypothetical protein
LGLRNVLFGRKSLAAPARERLFALTTAAVTLQTDLGLRTAGAGAICFKPLSAGDFVRAENDLQQLLDGITADSGSKVERREDRFGYTWIVVRDPELEDQVAAIYGYKRGAFWPFVPTGEGQERDNAEELELKAKLEPELPIEADLSRWFGVFDSPLGSDP